MKALRDSAIDNRQVTLESIKKMTFGSNTIFKASSVAFSIQMFYSEWSLSVNAK